MTFLIGNTAYIRTVLMAVALGLFFLLMYRFAAHAIVDRYVMAGRRLYDRLSSAMINADKDSPFSYEYIQRRLDAWGVTYYSRGKITPLVYLSGKMFCVIAGFAAGVMFGIVAAFVFAVPAFFYPDIHARIRNHRDNEKMLPSIMDVYDVVYLQTDAGEYITRTLIDAYRVTAHPRLKAALITLTGDIMSSNDLLVSIEVFGGK